MIEQGGTQLHQLNALRDQLVGGAKDLPALRANVTAVVAAIHAYASDARAAAASASVASSAAQAQLQQVDAIARANVGSLTHDIFERRIFDPYLHFATKEDEEAYRHRGEDAKRYIDQQLAQHTPQGDLNASAATVAHLNDAEAHGAGAYPGFQELKSKAEGDYQSLRAAMKAAGYSTVDADRRLTTANGAKADTKTVDPLDAITSAAPVSSEVVAPTAKGRSSDGGSESAGARRVVVLEHAIGGP